MKPVLFYDTETTGFPRWHLPSGDPSQPHITQIAAELYDEDSGNVLGSMNLLIKPNGWDIPEETVTMNGITTELAASFGVPASLAIDVFMRLWNRSELRVGHNESFDMRMIRIELMRLYDEETADDWRDGPAYCTQSNSTKIVNLPPSEKMLAAGQKRPKTPKLEEAYEFFTGRKLENAHNAAADVAACREVYFGILKHKEAA